MIQFCPYCNQPLKEIDGVYICPVHGKVLRDKEDTEKLDENPSYIG